MLRQTENNSSTLLRDESVGDVYLWLFFVSERATIPQNIFAVNESTIIYIWIG